MERLDKIRHLRDEIQSRRYKTQEKLEAIFEDLLRDVNKARRRS